MNDVSAQIAANLAQIHSRIKETCRIAGRSPDDVRLVAVSKYARPEWVRALVDLGHQRLGESRPQQLVARADEFGDQVDWHLIGHLQRNKVRSVLPHVSLIHSVDTVRLARRISEIAEELSLNPDILLEVNVSGEQAKDGFDSVELRSQWWSRLINLPHLRIRGLMTMAPACDDPEEARPVFQALRNLRDQLRQDAPDDLTLPELSTGMSGDFEIAIEEGATLIRIGSAIFKGLE